MKQQILCLLTGLLALTACTENSLFPKRKRQTADRTSEFATLTEQSSFYHGGNELRFVAGHGFDLFYDVEVRHFPLNQGQEFARCQLRLTGTYQNHVQLRGNSPEYANNLIFSLQSVRLLLAAPIEGRDGVPEEVCAGYAAELEKVSSFRWYLQAQSKSHFAISQFGIGVIKDGRWLYDARAFYANGNSPLIRNGLDHIYFFRDGATVNLAKSFLEDLDSTMKFPLRSPELSFELKVNLKESELQLISTKCHSSLTAKVDSVIHSQDRIRLILAAAKRLAEPVTGDDQRLCEKLENFFDQISIDQGVTIVWQIWKTANAAAYGHFNFKTHDRQTLSLQSDTTQVESK